MTMGFRENGPLFYLYVVSNGAMAATGPNLSYDDTGIGHGVISATRGP